MFMAIGVFLRDGSVVCCVYVCGILFRCDDIGRLDM